AATDAPGVMSTPARPSNDHGPFARFRRDHRRVLAQLDTLEQSASGSRRRAPRDPELRDMLALLARQFATHMTAEDTVLYPALADAFPLAPGAPRDEQLQVQTWDFVHLLRIHILKEEHSVFDLAERVLRPHEVRDLVERLEACFPQQSRGARNGRRKGSSRS